MSLTTFFGWSKPDNRADRDLWGIKLNAMFDAIDMSMNAVNVASVASPIGVVTPYAGSTAPTGFLIADGSGISRTTYSALFAKIGILHGQGDGTTTFNLPDARGKFIRYVDGGAGNDPDSASRTAGGTGGNTGDNVGSVQDHAMQGHFHEYWRNTSITPTGGTMLGVEATNSTLGPVDVIRDATDDGVNGTPKTSGENRGINLYMTPIIKY